MRHGRVPGFYTIYTVPKFYPLEVLVAVTFLLWTLVRRPRWRDLRDLWPLGIVLALAFATTAWAEFPQLAFSTAGHLGIGLLLLIMLRREFRERSFLKIGLIALTSAA